MLAAAAAAAASSERRTSPGRRNLHSSVTRPERRGKEMRRKEKRKERIHTEPEQSPKPNLTLLPSNVEADIGEKRQRRKNKSDEDC